MKIWIIIRDKIRVKENRPQTDTFDAFSYVKYCGIKDLDLSSDEVEELKKYLSEEEILKHQI